MEWTETQQVPFLPVDFLTSTALCACTRVPGVWQLLMLLSKAMDYINSRIAIKQILITGKTAFGEGLNRFATPISNCLIATTQPTFQTFCLIVISLISLPDSLIGCFGYVFTLLSGHFIIHLHSSLQLMKTSRIFNFHSFHGISFALVSNK